MEEFIIKEILQPELDRFVHHLCKVYNKPITTHQLLYSTDKCNLQLLSKFPVLHKEDGVTHFIDELTYDTSLDILS